jgi:hypothetical protein
MSVLLGSFENIFGIVIFLGRREFIGFNTLIHCPALDIIAMQLVSY